MAVINLALSIEAPMLDEFSSWSSFESLAVQMSEDIPGLALAQALDELQERLIEQVCGPKWAPQRGLRRRSRARAAGWPRTSSARADARGRAGSTPPLAGSRSGCGTWAVEAAGRCSRRCW